MDYWKVVLESIEADVARAKVADVYERGNLTKFINNLRSLMNEPRKPSPPSLYYLTLWLYSRLYQDTLSLLATMFTQFEDHENVNHFCRFKCSAL